MTRTTAKPKKVPTQVNDNVETTLHIYTRVSSVAQAEHGTSLEVQLEMGKKKAAELNFSWKHWNEGAKSSNHLELSKDHRPEFFALFSAIKAGDVKHLWVYDNSRMGRTDETLSDFRTACIRAGVILYTNNGVFDLNNLQDRLLKGMIDQLSQFENGLRAQKTRQGKIKAVERGKWHGGSPPFGYEIKNHILAINQDEAKWVRRIYQEAYNGTSVANIKKLLDDNKVSTRREKGRWSIGSIEAILRNTHYDGRYVFKGVEKPVTCPRIVDKDIWQAVTASRRRATSRGTQRSSTKNFYLLRDRMWCMCGKHMAGRIKPSKNEAMYYCPRKEDDWRQKGGSDTPYKRGGICPMTRSLNIPQTDELVWQAVKDLHSKSHLLKQKVKDRITSELQSDDNKEAVQKKKIKRLQKALVHAKEALGEADAKKSLGRMDAVSHKAAVAMINREIDKITEEIANTNLILKGMSNDRQWRDWYKRFGDEIKAKDNLSPQEKQEYLFGLIEKIEVRYLPEERSHELLLHFFKPIVGDRLVREDPKNRRSPYKIEGGKTEATLRVAKKDGRG